VLAVQFTDGRTVMPRELAGLVHAESVLILDRGDNPDEKDRVHVIATLAREDGRAPHLWRDYLALSEVAREYERHFGLRVTGAGAVTR